MTIYVLIVILVKTTSFEPVQHQQVVTNQAVFRTAESCLKNKIHNEEHYRQLGVWDQVKVECFPEELHK